MKYIIIIFVGIIVLGSLIVYPICYFNSKEDITINIKNKERVVIGSGQNIDSKFLVYTDKEVFENTDTYLFWKFNSADFQNNLEIGNSYQVKVVGWRIPFFSMFRNIVKINGNN